MALERLSPDRKSTRLNSSHTVISYAVFCLKKKKMNSMASTILKEIEAPNFNVLSMHPGWVKTDMGGEGADIDVATSVRGFFFNDTATTEIYTLSLHDALPI